MSSFTVPLKEADRIIAVSAAEWLGRFYPQASARVVDGAVELRASNLTEDQLAKVWTASLANERLHRENEPKRRELLEGLTR